MLSWFRNNFVLVFLVKSIKYLIWYGKKWNKLYEGNHATMPCQNYLSEAHGSLFAAKIDYSVSICGLVSVHFLFLDFREPWYFWFGYIKNFSWLITCIGNYSVCYFWFYSLSAFGVLLSLCFLFCHMIVATTVGTVVAYALVPMRSLGQDSWKVAAALMGRHIGGGLHFNF